MHSPVHRRERRLDRACTHRRFLFSWSPANPRTSWLDSPPTKTTIPLLWFVPIYRVHAHVYVSRIPEIICSLPAFSNTLPCHAITFIRVSEIKKRPTEESKAENRQICDQGYLQRNFRNTMTERKWRLLRSLFRNFDRVVRESCQICHMYRRDLFLFHNSVIFSVFVHFQLKLVRRYTTSLIAFIKIWIYINIETLSIIYNL